MPSPLGENAFGTSASGVTKAATCWQLVSVQPFALNAIRQTVNVSEKLKR